MAKSSASKSGSEHEPDSLDGEVVSPSICDGNGDEPVESKAELAPNRREDMMIKRLGISMTKISITVTLVHFNETEV